MARDAARGTTRSPARKSPLGRGKKAAKSKATTRLSNGAGARTRELMRIRELDPHAACGSGTTVLRLFRVDELPPGSGEAHLVFLDRRGWYCVHGRDCPAVAAAKRQHDGT
ncbi:MAG TPA: hypothetical protein VFK13_14555 [Gemmatimonadaceae bacterium]|nr:hypothetical protein [Gemmatimonadaceae bacterium]